MSSRKKKDARTLFKQAKARQVDSGGSTAPISTGGAAGAVGVASSKYRGKSKEELLALLRLKQAKDSGVAGQPRVAPAAARVVPVAQKVVVPIASSPKPGAEACPGPAKRSSISLNNGGLQGLLGIGTGDSDDDEDEDGGDGDSRSIPEPVKSAEKSPTTQKPMEAPSASGGDDVSHEQGLLRKSNIPEGLPEGFFDNPEQSDTSVEPVASGSHDLAANGHIPQVPNTEKADSLLRAVAAKPRKLDPARMAELEAEAAEEAKRDEERLAALQAAGLVRLTAPENEEKPTIEEDAGGADEPPSMDTAAGGSALPEGFFDDPEVDARSRGVDLEAKKKAEEQDAWKDFMSFAQEMKNTEKEQEDMEEQQEEDKGQYQELEQAALMGRLAVLLNTSESVGRKRRREGVEDDAHHEKLAGGGHGGQNGTSGDTKLEEAERSVEEAGSAMREVAVASAPTDVAAGEISLMLRERRRKKKREVQDAFTGDYVPMNPLDWRAKGR